VRFGELIEVGGATDERPRRAGFGIEGEVRELRREKIYGFDGLVDGTWI
jgi:hypothetical protein